ncbi:hypothetical protein BGX31_007686 [Mortierella sp. GBA43]|nr:hypothetical protein BGX31_007686 [Mortierella sp. GBA43]
MLFQSVCKAWYSVLSPKLWVTLGVGAGHKDRGYVHKSVHLDGLERHVQLIRFLDIALMPPTMPKAKDPEAQEAEERLKAILARCCGLRHLKTNSLYDDLFNTLGNSRKTMIRFEWAPGVEQDQGMTRRLWQVLSDDSDALRMSHLRHLTLSGLKIQDDGDHPALHLVFSKLCQRLVTLECIGCTMKDWIPQMPLSDKEDKNAYDEDDTQQIPWSLKKIKFMEVVEPISLHVRFFKRCPFLKQLTWCSQKLEWNSRVEQPLDPGFLQFLTQSRLKLLAVDGLALPDESLAKLMDHLPPTFTTLCLNTWNEGVKIGPQFVAAAAALTSPSLSLLSFEPGRLNLSSSITQQLFSSCDRIVRIGFCPHMDAVDLLSAPWTMTRIVRLTLTIEDVATLRSTVYSTYTGNGGDHHGSIDLGGHRVIYEQLSRLVSLEDLTLSEGAREPRPSCIDFSLRHGMGELATLERLRCLDITRLEGLRMGADEAAWICDHWPTLAHLEVSSFHSDVTSCDYVMAYLHKNRPRLLVD